MLPASRRPPRRVWVQEGRSHHNCLVQFAGSGSSFVSKSLRLAAFHTIVHIWSCNTTGAELLSPRGRK